MFSTYLLQDLIAAYDTSIHLVYENLAPELPRFAHLLTGYDLGMLLKEAQDLLSCRHLFIVENAASRLSDPLLYQRQEVLEVLQKTPRYKVIGMFSQHFDDPYRLSTARLGDPDQLPVSFFEFLFGFLTFASCDPVQPLSCAPDAAVASTEDLLAQSVDLFGRKHLLRSSEQAAQNPHPVAKKSTVGRVMDVALNHHRIHPQLP